MSPAAERVRCPWSLSTPLYREYHDREWGVPSRDRRHLFEMLVLEGAQAGLSWSTILNKREHYRRVYDGFDPAKMARWDANKRRALMADAGIVRNRLKIEAAQANARAVLALERGGEDLVELLWSFTGGKPVQNAWKTLREIPAETEASRAMSRALKARGFRFVGPTICYAFMQATGMVDDHLVDCFRRRSVRAARRR
jgi:DNA-3-methyladenine glycosylase I